MSAHVSTLREPEDGAGWSRVQYPPTYRPEDRGKLMGSADQDKKLRWLEVTGDLWFDGIVSVRV